jgi:hypothetical protein
MKHIKKRLRKKTVEAYACLSCGSPDDCIVACAGDIGMLAGGANYATILAASRK